MALGEISVQVVPDLSKFLDKLSADLKRATNQIDRSTEKVAENVEESFRETGRVVDRTFDEMRKDVDRSLDGVSRSAEDNADKLERSFKDAANDSEAALGGIGNGLGGVVAKLGAALAAFGLGSFLKDATLDAEAANKAFATTVQLIEATGGKAGVTADQIEALSKNLLFKIGIDDTDVVRASNVLLTFTGVTGDIFDETIARAADLQTVFGTDLSGAAMQLGKALNDPVRGINALRRSGVSFTKEQTEQIKTMVAQGKTAEAQRLILDELARQFGGTAEASASSTKRIGAFFDELKESVGAGLLPAIEAIAPSIVVLLQTLQGPMQQFGEMFGEFLGPVLDVFAAVLPDAVRIFGTILEAVGATLSALAPVIEPLVAILADVAEAFGRAFVDLLTMAQPLIEFFVEAIGQAADTVLPILFGIFEDLAPIIGEVLGILGRLAQRVFPVLLKIVEKVAPVIGEILLQALDALVPVFEVIADQIVYLLPVFETLGDLLVTSFRTLAPILPTIAQAFIRIVQALVPLIPQLIKIVQALLPPLLELVVALAPLIADGLALAVEGLSVALAKVLEVIMPVITFIGDLIGKVAEGISKFETIGELLSGIWEGIKTAVKGVADFVGQQIDNIVGFVTGLPGRMLAAVLALVKAGASLGKAFIDAFLYALKAVGGFFADIGKAIANALIDAINWATQKINDFIPNKIGFGPVSINLPDDPIPPIPRLMAEGGIINSPTFAMIGEAGPEMVLPLSRPARARDLLMESGLSAVGQSNTASPTVQIQEANFYDGTDATLVAQKVYTAMSLANAA